MNVEIIEDPEPFDGRLERQDGGGYYPFFAAWVEVPDGRSYPIAILFVDGDGTPVRAEKAMYEMVPKAAQIGRVRDYGPVPYPGMYEVYGEVYD